MPQLVQKYEYKLEFVLKMMEKMDLNKHGSRGWILTQVLQATGGGWYYIFTRELKE